jgi:integrase
MIQSVDHAQFARSVLDLYQVPIRRKATRAKIRQALEEFAAICPDTAALTPGAVARWLAAHPGRTPRTAYSLLRAMRTAVRAGIALGLVPSDPFAFRSPRAWFPAGALEDPTRRRHHGAEAIARVLRRADAEAYAGPWRAWRLRAAVYGVAYTGCRAREVLGALAADYDRESGLFWVRPNARRPLKTAASHAPLPACPALAAVLDDWVDRIGGSPWLIPGRRRSGPWLGGAPGYRPVDQLRKLGERAGVEGLTFLSLRHSFATLSESWGLGEAMIQRLLRHSRPQTQRAYRHADLDAMREAVSRVHFV